jgi:ATP-dependent Lon protease
VLAAHRAGLREVILPLRNEADLDDVPEAVRNEMTFHPVADVSKVLDLALEPLPAATSGRGAGAHAEADPVAA